MKLPKTVNEEITAEFKALRGDYVETYLAKHLTEVFSISEFYPAILAKLQTAILDGYTIAPFDQQPFYNIGDPAMRIVMNKKPQEIDTERRSLTVAAEAQLRAALEAKAAAMYAEIVADMERVKREQEAAERAAEQEARTFESRLRVALSDAAK
ncbi:hypothetical protein ACXYLT_003075 [Klebsiella aerogenes]